MRYIRIENTPKFIPTSGFLFTLGASHKRGSTNDTMIGQFGTGKLYSLALAGRTIISDNDIMLYHIKTCLGTEQIFTYSIDVKEEKDNDGFKHNIGVIQAHEQGSGKKDTNISIGFGIVDWRDPIMILREIISNAYDGASDGKVKIEVVEENQRSAKGGTIRVYLPLIPAFEDYLKNLSRHFLMNDPKYNHDVQIMNNSIGENTRIYRRGVLVGELGKGLFSYNFKDIPLNECRVVNPGEARDKMGTVLANAAQSFIEKYLTALINNEECYENKLELYDIQYYIKEDNKQVWRAAFNKVLNGCVPTFVQEHLSFLEKKGYTGKLVNAKVFELCKVVDVPTSIKFIDTLEQKGMVKTDPSEDSIRALDEVWLTIESLGMATKDKPVLNGYFMYTGGAGAIGFWSREDDSINVLNTCGYGQDLIKTVIHEVTHYLTKASDCTREFEDAPFNMLAHLIYKRFN